MMFQPAALLPCSLLRRELRLDVTNTNNRKDRCAWKPSDRTECVIVNMLLSRHHTHTNNNYVAVTYFTCMHVGVLRTKVPPLETIHGSQVALLSICEPKIVQEVPGPVGIPNLHSFLRELLGIR